ncbi:STAS domain-containing protein [Actinokineospora pegani]|uniref:STAS domain-containing protein n=1 Tax=Actinokineospora pegani TaxID=2654637 RepID=UPI0012E9A787|nr:STAS domain-containing protein [Actinokineospora pegani]
MNDFHHNAAVAGGRVLVTAVGELDMHNSGEFRQDLLDLLADDTELVVDLAGLSFVDSSGLSVFIAVHKAALSHSGACLVLRDVPPFLNRILAVTGLSAVLQTAAAS